MRINIFKLFLLFSLFLVLFIKTNVSLDPDLGWRIKAGQDYLNFGIPESDPYSYTMPSFPWVDHAWVTTIFIGRSYETIGKGILSFIFALLAFFAFLIGYKRVLHEKKDLLNVKLRETIIGNSLGMYSSFVFLLSFAIILPFSGIRAQIVSWFLLSLFFYLIDMESKYIKFRLFLPLFFLIWANLHGGFLSGLLVYFIYLISICIRKKMLFPKDILILLLSTIATFINPYGAGIWREVLSSVTDSKLRFAVMEWMPALFNFDIAAISLSVISVFLVYKYHKKFKLEELLIYLFLLVGGISSRRNLPLWVLYSLPLSFRAVNYLYDEIKNIKFGKRRFGFLYKALWIMSVSILLIQSGFALWGSFYLTEDTFYPKNAVNYLRNNSTDGNIFSNYGWGGYLIWKYPQKKVFVDGRMPSWRWDKAPLGESAAAFDDYRDILSGEQEFEEAFALYNIDIVLWPKTAPPSLMDKLDEKITKTLEEFSDEEEVGFNFLEELRSNNFEVLYEDEKAVVLKKTN